MKNFYKKVPLNEPTIFSFHHNSICLRIRIPNITTPIST